MFKKELTLITLAAFLISCNSGNSGSNNIKQPSRQLNIQNGIPAEDPEINGMVPLILIGDSALCTGTVISPNTILTAAHCVLNMRRKPHGVKYQSMDIIPPVQIKVVFNQNLYRPVHLNDDNPQLEWYSVKNVYVHNEAFLGVSVLKNGSLQINDLMNVNDLAILKLEQELDKIRHPAARLASELPKINSKILITGYGVDNGSEVEVSDPFRGEAGVLRYAAAKVAAYESKYLFIGGIPDPVLGYTRICSGDSGGPDLMHIRSGGYQIVGVHSFGTGKECGAPRSLGASVSISDYLEWVNSFI